MLRPLLAGLALAALAVPALADHERGTAADPYQLNHYSCFDFSLAKVAFADGRAIVLWDGHTLSLPYVAELPGDSHVYADGRTVMVLGDDDIWIGPQTMRGNAIVRPDLQCRWVA